MNCPTASSSTYASATRPTPWCRGHRSRSSSAGRRRRVGRCPGTPQAAPTSTTERRGVTGARFRAVPIVNRGFKGRRSQAGAGLIPPGQYLVDDFPVLTAGPTQFTPLAEWDFTIVDESGAAAGRWTWEELQ